MAERTDELVAAGMTEKEARREALRRFGNYTSQKEKTRDMNIAGAIEALVANLKYGLRQLRLSPGFTTVAVLSLALGIGANSAIFQLIDAIRLRSLPVHEPSELVMVDEAPNFMTSGWYAARNRAFTWAQIQEIRRVQQAFSGVLVFGTQRFNLSRGGESRFAEGLYVSANYFDLLGVKPLLGTTFSGTTNPAAETPERYSVTRSGSGNSEAASRPSGAPSASRATCSRSSAWRRGSSSVSNPDIASTLPFLCAPTR